MGAIARHNLGITSGDFGPNFKLIFYVSFQSRIDSCCLELCEALHNYCQKHKKNNFELVLRLSKEKINPARWNEQWIHKTLEKHIESKKVWICGPPPMSETFEKYVYNQRIEHNKMEHIEIL